MNKFWLIFNYYFFIHLGAYVDLKKIVVKPNMTAAKSVQSDAVFERIRDRVNEDPTKAKSVNAVFVYKITEGGKVVKEWGKSDNGVFF